MSGFALLEFGVDVGLFTSYRHAVDGRSCFDEIVSLDRMSVLDCTVDDR